MVDKKDPNLMKKRFRGFYPLVIDIETGGLEAKTDAILEIAAISLDYDEDGNFYTKDQYHHHIKPFPGAKIKDDSLKITGIDPHHPFRFAIDELEALEGLFKFAKQQQKQHNCSRCVLVGHNSWFDLGFLNAAIIRCKIKDNPFHKFTSLDTASMGALVYGQTVLAQVLKAAKIKFDIDQSHSALYDATKTAQVFCKMINEFKIDT